MTKKHARASFSEDADDEQAISEPSDLQQLRGNAASIERLHERQRTAEGLSGPGASIPHRTTLERAIGLDLGHFVAHTDNGAQEACRILGAHGYAEDGHAAFEEGTTLFEAAHEVAHLVQEEHGMPAGWSDREAHADEVAKRVTAGEDARNLIGSRGPRPLGVAFKKKLGPLQKISALEGNLHLSHLMPEDDKLEVTWDDPQPIRKNGRRPPTYSRDKEEDEKLRYTNKVNVDTEGYFKTTPKSASIPAVRIKSLRQGDVTTGAIAADGISIRRTSSKADKTRVMLSVTSASVEDVRIPQEDLTVGRISLSSLDATKQFKPNKPTEWLEEVFAAPGDTAAVVKEATLQDVRHGDQHVDNITGSELKASYDDQDGTSVNFEADAINAENMTGSGGHITSANAKGLKGAHKTDLSGETTWSAGVEQVSAQDLQYAQPGVEMSAGSLEGEDLAVSGGSGQDTVFSTGELSGEQLRRKTWEKTSKEPTNKATLAKLIRLIEDVEGQVTLPLNEGTYGHGLKKTKVPANTSALVAVEIKDGEIVTSKTEVKLQQEDEKTALDTFWFTLLDGAYMTPEGKVFLDIRRFWDINVANMMPISSKDGTIPTHVEGIASAIENSPPGNEQKSKKKKRKQKNKPLSSIPKLDQASFNGDVSVSPGKKNMGNVSADVAPGNTANVTVKRSGRSIVGSLTELLLRSLGYKDKNIQVEVKGISGENVSGKQIQTSKGSTATTLEATKASVKSTEGSF